MPSHRSPAAEPASTALVSGDTSTTTTTIGGGRHGGGTPPTIAEEVDRLFTRIDTNSDASLSQAELAAALDPDGSNATELTQQITTADSNADGSLSKAEVTAVLTALDTDGDGTLQRSERSAALTDGSSTLADSLLDRHHGTRAEPTPKTVSEVVTDVFTVFDTDVSTTISLAEIVAVLTENAHNGHGGKTLDAQSLAESIVALVDTNTDGSLSNAEFTAAVTALDVNGDGSLSRSDFVGADADAVKLIGALLHALPHDAATGA